MTVRVLKKKNPLKIRQQKKAKNVPFTRIIQNGSQTFEVTFVKLQMDRQLLSKKVKKYKNYVAISVAADQMTGRQESDESSTHTFGHLGASPRSVS